ncbi:GspH/FimT family pseudopilin [Parendozoicomonas haliclonae]|uniref:Type II secretion system protein H n=1 Tax=Parendozoicomonas haliclonae TaxID=1960125 RepID=A0A1X7AQJ9_9GAMM|nr:GspH/FimT family pseudopilin [Parendozoicomonas haliclonae]SMA50369.1 Type II transport protein GspH [Parendozoicomonas haliclonae]
MVVASDLHRFLPKRESGLSLMEVLWGTALLGIIMLAGLPALSGMVKRYEAESDFRNFRNIVSYARAEAIVRKKDVVLCPRKSGSEECYDTAISSDDDEETVWKNGWILFVNNEGAETAIEADDLILKVYEPLDQNLTLRMGGSTGAGGQLAFLRFMSKGNSFPNNPSALFCQLEGDDVNFAGRVVIAFGRVRIDERSVAEGLCDAL